MPYSDPEKERAYREANREKIRAQQRVRHARIREEKRLYLRRYYAENREKMLAQMRDKHAENPEVKRKQVKAWRRANPEKVAANERKYRVRKRGAETVAYVATLRLDPCAYCGGPAGDADHIDPRIHGGEDRWTNLTAACRQCNSSKNARKLLLWLGR